MPGRPTPQLAAACLLLLAGAAAGAGHATPWPWPPHPSPAWDSAWARILEALWNATSADVGFCLGSRQSRVERLLRLSFQWPPPAGPPGDGVCSNATLLAPFLCNPYEVEVYYQVRRGPSRRGEC